MHDLIGSGTLFSVDARSYPVLRTVPTEHVFMEADHLALVGTSDLLGLPFGILICPLDLPHEATCRVDLTGLRWLGCLGDGP